MMPNGNENVDMSAVLIFTLAVMAFGLGVCIYTVIERWKDR